MIGDLNFALMTDARRSLDLRGHYNRPELLSLLIGSRPSGRVRSRFPGTPGITDVEEGDRVIA